MKVVALFCLLFVAGSCALPETEVVAPAQDRIVTMVVTSWIQAFRNFVLGNNMDPWILIDHTFNVVIINQLFEVKGGVKEFECNGLSNVGINNMYYNPFLTRFDFDVVMPEISLSIGKYYVRIIYGDNDFSFELSGTLVITNIRFVGDALIPLYPRVVINNINPNLSIESIEAEVSLIGSEDYSEFANELLNQRIPGFLATFSREINTIIGMIITEVVNWLW